MITIIDYGIGNLASVLKMVTRVNGNAMISSNTATLKASSKIVIAGVGAFDHGMSNLRDGGWIDSLNEAVRTRRVPILGICLGMQLMCISSEEGKLAGLGWIDAEVKRFRLPANWNQKVPHMGWNTVDVLMPNPLIDPEESQQRFYFAHSYHVVCNVPQDVIATTHHGYDVTAAFSHGNIFGVQFHPEKSHRFGMALMKRFVELQC